MRPECYVALDLETTGLDPAQDAIIELGAVKVREGREAGRFQSLVNPGRDIPFRVRRLTGIDQDVVDSAPGIFSVLPHFLSFLEDLPLVAHNASFDMSFLAATGLRAGIPPLDNPVWDSWELARLALPAAKGHSLACLAQSLGVKPTGSHRALPDAITLSEVFRGLVEELPHMGRETASSILELMGKGWPLGPLIKLGLDSPGQDNRVVHDWLPLEERQVTRPLDPSECRSLLEPGGAMERALPSYEPREGQLEMLDAVIQAFNSNGLAAIQAGTGTGKSMAYLIPSALWAMENESRVVVSTHTIALQEQLVGKDIPLLERVLGARLRVCALKGRENYLCWRKWEGFRGARLTMGPEERRFAALLTAWLSKTRTGDRWELNLLPQEYGLWPMVGGEEDGCPTGGCRFRNRCFTRLARGNARGAHLVVVNHSLLLSDVKARNAVIPCYEHLVIDEAHHLDEQASQHLGVHLDLSFVLRFLRAYAHGEGEAGKGAFTAMERRILRLLGRQEWVVEMLGRARASLSEALSSAESAAGLVASFVRGMQVEPDEPYPVFRFGARHRQDQPFMALREEGGRLAGQLKTVSDALGRLADALDEGHEDLKADLAGKGVRLARWAAEVGWITGEHDEDWVYWAEAGRKEEVSLHASLIDSGDILRDRLFRPLKSCVMTSATLAMGESFDYFLRPLGLQGLSVTAVDIPSSFRYDSRVYLAVASDMPLPSSSEFETASAAFIKELAMTLEGRTLALFTSHFMLRSVSEAIRGHLEDQGIGVLAQGVDGSRTGILEEFRAQPRSLLLGLASFWEGVDVPGEGLSAVVLVRLPFQPPSRPLAAARRERLQALGRNAFYALSLPEATLKLKQGFGRLMRSSQDRGVVVILDPRASPGGSAYWFHLIGSLPRAQFYSGSRANILEAAWTFVHNRGPVPIEEVLDC
jgi:ATP-dependent DNA helicase DinG